MLWPPAETRPTFGRYKPAGQNPLISGRLELVGLKKVETHVKIEDFPERSLLMITIFQEVTGFFVTVTALQK